MLFMVSSAFFQIDSGVDSAIGLESEAQICPGFRISQSRQSGTVLWNLCSLGFESDITEAYPLSKQAKNSRTSSRKWRWLALATVVFFVGAGIYFLITTVGESKRLEQRLIDQFGWTNEYTPPLDGFMPAERVESFIRVREAVQSNCKVFQGILHDINNLEALEEDKEMPAGEKTSKGLDTFKKMFSAAPKYLEFMDARNSTLLEEKMGLGEYFYIYLASYGPQLAGEFDSSHVGNEEAFISQRTRKEFVLILENQLANLEAAGQDDSYNELITELQSQIETLSINEQSVPWPNGPASKTRESLAPFHRQLTELYCSGIARIELTQKNRGLNLEG